VRAQLPGGAERLMPAILTARPRRPQDTRIRHPPISCDNDRGPAGRAGSRSRCFIVPPGASRPPLTTPRASPDLVFPVRCHTRLTTSDRSVESSLSSLSDGYFRCDLIVFEFYTKYYDSLARWDAIPSVLLRSAGTAAVFCRIHSDGPHARTSVNEILRNRDSTYMTAAGYADAKDQAIESPRGIGA
jgi:hypothetical protein